LSPPARKGRGEEAEPDPAVFQLLAAARAASGGGAWEDAPPLFQRPETFQPLFLQIPKGFPAVSCYFLGVGSVILGC